MSIVGVSVENVFNATLNLIILPWNVMNIEILGPLLHFHPIFCPLKEHYAKHTIHAKTLALACINYYFPVEFDS